MKSIFIAFLSLLSGSVAMASTPVERLVPVDHVYSPKGFDTNDNTEVVVSGYLPNLCHKSPKVTVKVIGNTIDVKLTSLYYHQSNPFCPEMIVPFVQAVSVGVLDKGDYKVVVNRNTVYQKDSKIFISEASSDAIDSYVYASVDYVEKSADTQKVVLKGYNPSDCFELAEIRTVSNDKDTYSVLPIMKQVREHCPMKMIPFEYEMAVPTQIQSEKVLLHVRSMDGRSVNTLINTQN